MARRISRRSFSRRYAPLLLAGVAVLVIVGLRTDDSLGFDLADQLEQEGEEVAGATSTTKDDEPPVTATLPTVSTSPGIIDDPDDVPDSLREAQLTTADLPGGWAPASNEDNSIEVCPGHDPASDVEPDHALKAGFTGGDDGPGLTSVVLEFGSDGEADDYLDALEDVFDECNGLKDERGLTYTFERTQDTSLGDRSVTATQSIEAPTARAQGRVLSVRVGDRVALVAFVAVGDADASVAVEALETVVARLDG
jgi:hypothetical protein